MRTKVEIKRYREVRRRRDAAAYAREHRAAKREARAPDARAIGAALLSLALDMAVVHGKSILSTQVIARLAKHGYDPDAALAAIAAMEERHAVAMEIEREAAAQAA